MFKSKTLIAVDIGTSSIKVAEIVVASQSGVIKKFAADKLPIGTFEQGVVVDEAAVIQVLKKIVSSLGIKNRRASISVSGGGVMLKKIRVAATGDSSIGEQILHHAAQAFQLDMSEMYFDYVEMGEAPNSRGEVDVLLVGARREVVEQYVSIIRAAGMDVGAVEASALSLANMFELNYGVSESLVAIVSIGASHLQIGFVERGRFLYSQEMPIGGDYYTKAIMQVLNLQQDDAEALKINSCGNPASATAQVLQIIKETNTLIANDIRQAIGLFQASAEGADAGPLKYCFLTGGASLTLNLNNAIATALAVPVQFANPFQRLNIEVSGIRDVNIGIIGPVIGCAVGLGLRVFGDKVAV
jgi:type IV pilus assembly protein PilM